ncbi:MAG: DNA polymerase III subunit delta' [Coriobacteriales bacterium]|nr:DNA polymerase III subunit delta' [Coriobacteriales bacterium]
MTLTGRLLEGIKYSQNEVYSFLSNVIEQNSYGHAYLFLGPSGSGKLEAARALAQGILCSNSCCGICDDCQRVASDTHPDLHTLSPQSAQGYLIGQIRDLINDLDYKPMLSQHKVYILNDAQNLTPSSANALLKSLEEPPGSVVFILLGTSGDAILPTIVSRCQTITFKPVSHETMVLALTSELGILPEKACEALSCCTSLEQARSFLGSVPRQNARKFALDCFTNLSRADSQELLNRAKKAVQAAKDIVADYKESSETLVNEQAKLLSKTAIHDLEEQQKREIAQRERMAYKEQLHAMRSLLRDSLTLQCGYCEQPTCPDFINTSKEIAQLLCPTSITKALQYIQSCIEALEANATPLLAYEALLMKIQRLYC